MNIKVNRKNWAFMLKALPCFAIGGWFLTIAGWHVALAIGATVTLELAVVFLCERGLAITRMTAAATVFVLPELMLSSIMIHANANRWMAAAIVFGVYFTVLIFAWREKPRRLMSAGWWSVLFILGVVAFVLALRYWPDAMSRARWVVEIVRILVSGDWII